MKHIQSTITKEAIMCSRFPKGGSYAWTFKMTMTSVILTDVLFRFKILQQHDDFNRSGAKLLTMKKSDTCVHFTFKVFQYDHRTTIQLQGYLRNVLRIFRKNSKAKTNVDFYNNTWYCYKMYRMRYMMS